MRKSVTLTSTSKKSGSKIDRHLIPNWGAYLIVALFIMVELFPLLWMVSTSFKQPGEYFNSNVKWLPSVPTLDHYANIFSSLQFGGFMANSLIVTVASTFLAVVFGMFGAYALARFETGGPLLSFTILLQRMAPPIVIVIPLFLLFSNLGQLDTLGALIFAYVGANLPFALWLLKGFFAEVPSELEEAGLIDGCSRFGALWKIVMPLAAPGVVATSVLVAVQAWNEFFLAVILTNSPNSQTLPVAISTLIVPVVDIQWGEMSAAAVLAIIPVFIFALFVQRRLVEGLTGGAVKG
ncbi:MAG TPA: carbohydrate ABC transporter permease [Chloroflexia bacterium]|nr:carbohydrate ABC transporter permease [Chloroflexia bacterium]